ncbi:beta-lactamase/transpeptidase-like protein [Mytilinidion resinicola]|uniref:Beta-lactamase/transpeptidase-like protein n=1 Tax=Mytilinidion resinicola TaxID=574789 RepID=A0A6A6Y8E6_9PEZI|nr:beta-lactamase/transpeptidase-like protein [Mytilinidion resinicola]KAF2804405.1 beta-lactamase/transpeptidase-like protein [Mytilinidion resinicola]
MDDSLVARLKAQSAAIADIQRVAGTPGLSLGVFHHGRILHTAHFGRRDVGSLEPVNDDSVYFVASAFKIVTVSAIARLVTDGLLGWDVPVRDYLPAFQQRHDEVGLKATIRDLIANRTGWPMASCYWGQQNGEQLLDKSEFVSIANSLEAVKPFRSTFIYSQWNYCLIHIIVESVTGKSFGHFVREAIFEPLHLTSSTFDIPTTTNLAKPHATRNDGSACSITTNNFDSSTGLAAGGGGKSTIKEMLTIYMALLAAYRHQVDNNVDTTPNSPFTQLRTIFTPHIHVTRSQLDKQAYCLGLYRTQLPGNLSCASINSLMLRNKIPIFGDASGTDIFHHSSTTPGYFGAMYMVPSTQSGVVVLTNATPLMDAADFSAQLLLSVLLGVKAPAHLLSLAKTAAKTQIGWYDQLSSFLASGKTDTPPTHPLSAYSGTYINAAHNFRILVTPRADGLHVSMQGKPLTTYVLKPWDGDSFSWEVDRERELIDRGMFLTPFPQIHLMHFGVTEKAVQSLTWQHDPLAEPELFQRDDGEALARL